MTPTRKDALDLPARRRIVDAVAEHPGLHMRALAARLDLALSSLEYHTYHLVRTGHLTTRESGGLKAFYPAAGMDRRDKDVLFLVRQEAVRRICIHLVLHPGATPKDVKEAVGISGPTLTFHLRKLRAAGLVAELPSGRTKLLTLTDAERVANVLVTYRASLLDDVVDRFARTWLELRRP